MYTHHLILISLFFSFINEKKNGIQERSYRIVCMWPLGRREGWREEGIPLLNFIDKKKKNMSSFREGTSNHLVVELEDVFHNIINEFVNAYKENCNSSKNRVAVKTTLFRIVDEKIERSHLEKVLITDETSDDDEEFTKFDLDDKDFCKLENYPEICIAGDITNVGIVDNSQYDEVKKLLGKKRKREDQSDGDEGIKKKRKI